MKKVNLVAVLSLGIMLLPLIMPMAIATQPPVDTTTMYVATIGWGPRRADPVRAYDTASGELLFNVYDTLIEFDREKYWEFVPGLAINVPERQENTSTFVNTTVFDPRSPEGTWLNGTYKIVGYVDNNPDGVFGPVDVLYLMEYSDGSPVTCRTWQIESVNLGAETVIVAKRFYYDFIIRTDPVIKFYDSAGQEVGTFDIGDVEYSFKRGLVQDEYGSPMWMFYKPFFDQMNSDFWYTADPADAWELSYLIKDSIEIVAAPSPTIRINLGIAFPVIAFKQIMSQTWASVLDKGWCIIKGCWDGELFSDDGRYPGSTANNNIPDWFEALRHRRSPIYTVMPENYAGSGPYRVTVTDSAAGKVILERNVNYWKGWPAPGCGGYVEKVVIAYIKEWSTRRDAFIACDYDVCAVPRAFISDLVEPDAPPGDPLYPPYTNYVDVPIKTIKGIPTLVLDAMHLTFTVNPISEFIGTGSLANGKGIPTDFFNNTHVRKTWAYAFNWTNYIRDAYFNEALYRKNPLIYGLAPDYYDPSVPTYYESLQKAMEELQQAHFIVDGEDKTVWETGFTVKIAYNAGNDMRRIACEMLQSFFAKLSTYGGRTGPPFTVEVVELPWPTILDKFENFELPTWIIGWLADFADADNWMRPYMHSYGDFAYFQNYTIWNGWTTPGPSTGLNKDQLIDIAAKTPDGPLRAQYYRDLQWIYYYDAPSIPLAQPLGRRWCKYWVRGWYYNALYPAQYYYHLWKHDTCWFDITGPTPGVYDDIVNARDVTYLVLHFGARPPVPGFQDPLWVGTYGWGGVDSYGDRICNARDITWTILHFGHGPGKP